MNYKRICDHCQSSTSESEQMTCCSNHVDLFDFGSSAKGCYDDAFYCPKCLNKEGFCPPCGKELTAEEQKNIGLYLDTGDRKYKNETPTPK